MGTDNTAARASEGQRAGGVEFCPKDHPTTLYRFGTKTTDTGLAGDGFPDGKNVGLEVEMKISFNAVLA